MSDVLVGQSYYLRLDRTAWAARQPYAPLGALYAAAMLRERGYDVSFFDAMLAAEADWERALERDRPRIAVVYEDNFNYLSKMCLGRMRQAAFTMIDRARARGAAVVVAGPDATDNPEPYLKQGASAVVIGEGEVTLSEVVATLRGRVPRALAEIPGLCLAGADGARRTAIRAPIRDLDTLPRPAWDLVDVERYRTIWQRRHGYFSMNVATTRGCPYHCNWCAKPIYGQRYAVRDPSAVAREIAWLKAAYRPDHLWIMDDIFGLRPGWIERFADELVRTDAVIPFKCLSRADLLEPSVIGALRRAGCRTVWIGAESGSQKILDAMEKGLRVEQIRTAVQRLRAAGIDVAFFLQFGYPGETRDDIEATRRLVRECAPADIGISVSYPLPGTRFYERVRAELGETRNWKDSGDLAMLYRGPFSGRFYRALHQLVHAEFRMRRAGAALRRARLLSALGLRALASWMRHAVPWMWARWRVERLGYARPPLARPLATPSEQRV